MRELEKILEEISLLDIIYDLDNGGCLLRQEDVENIIHNHMNDGWIPVEKRLPTQEECKDNWFWIAYGDSFGNSPRIAKCEWVFADDEDGNDDSGPEFYIDQFPLPYKPSKNLIKAWKIIDIPAPYRPERNE